MNPHSQELLQSQIISHSKLAAAIQNCATYQFFTHKPHLLRYMPSYYIFALRKACEDDGIAQH